MYISLFFLVQIIFLPPQASFPVMKPPTPLDQSLPSFCSCLWWEERASSVSVWCVGATRVLMGAFLMSTSVGRPTCLSTSSAPAAPNMAPTKVGAAVLWPVLHQQVCWVLINDACVQGSPVESPPWAQSAWWAAAAVEPLSTTGTMWLELHPAAPHLPKEPSTQRYTQQHCESALHASLT